mmetsp:Transcript_14504/g.36316  ORF Transcript_14504/g.36316 Transcript_14504/m.36316 type:complete len:376 (+) Transcript_14504:674-1801(+)
MMTRPRPSPSALPPAADSPPPAPEAAPDALPKTPSSCISSCRGAASRLTATRFSTLWIALRLSHFFFSNVEKIFEAFLYDDFFTSASSSFKCGFMRSLKNLSLGMGRSPSATARSALFSASSTFSSIVSSFFTLIAFTPSTTSSMSSSESSSSSSESDESDDSAAAAACLDCAGAGAAGSGSSSGRLGSSSRKHRSFWKLTCGFDLSPISQMRSPNTCIFRSPFPLSPFLATVSLSVSMVPTAKGCVCLLVPSGAHTYAARTSPNLNSPSVSLATTPGIMRSAPCSSFLETSLYVHTAGTVPVGIFQMAYSVGRYTPLPSGSKKTGFPSAPALKTNVLLESLTMCMGVLRGMMVSSMVSSKNGSDSKRSRRSVFT